MALSKYFPLSLIKWIFRVLFLAASWLFLWLDYGDVLYQLQEQSLWFYAPYSDYDTLKINIDLFTYAARFCITLFAVPVLGAGVLAILLSLTEILTDSIFRFKASLYAISYIPATGLLLYICSHDKTIYYGHENSTIFKVLAVTLAVMLVIWCISRFFRHSRTNESISLRMIICDFILLAAAFLFVRQYANRDREFRTITSLKYQMDQRKWSNVVSIAESSGISNRVIAGYHVAALSQIGQVGNRLFKVGYDFPKFSSTGKVDNLMQGDALCYPQMLFYGGLVQPAYHYAFEYYIIYGNHKEYLRIMVKSTVLKRDVALADKLLDIMERIPFEKNFVEKYRRYNHNPDEMQKDSELASVLDLTQSNETFEQRFGAPLSVNFYMSVNPRKGSQRFQDLALAGTLYYKNIQLFANKCNVLLKRKNIPTAFQEAIAFISARTNNREIVKMYNISPEIISRVNNFLTESTAHMRDSDKGKSAMSKYRGTMMYYLLYENESLQELQ